MGLVGALAALGSSFTWAFASVRYAQVSREIGGARVNFARAAVVGPFYLLIATSLHGRGLASGITAGRAGWLALSVVCSYVLADTLFLSASRRAGIATALSIASTYPLWAALVGVAFRGERFGIMRGAGTLLCIVGVVVLVRVAPTGGANSQPGRRGGLLLAGITSIMWAGNSIAVKFGSPGLDVAQVNGVRYSFALVVLALGIRVTGGPLWPPTRSWAMLAPAIVADGVLGSSLYVYGVAHSDLAIGATLTSLAPLISVPIAIAMGEERCQGRSGRDDGGWRSYVGERGLSDQGVPSSSELSFKAIGHRSECACPGEERI
jgi:drug/metabolite transporter (DMT)-like permease